MPAFTYVATVPFVASVTEVVECPEDCLAHINLLDADGNLGAVATCDTAICEMLIATLTEALKRRRSTQ